MASKKYEIEGIGAVALYKKRGNNHIRMSFARDGSIRVSLPYWVPYHAGIEFALSRQNWIAKHRPAVNQLLRHQDRIGKAHQLVIEQHHTNSKPTVRVARNKIKVLCPVEYDETHEHVQTAAERGALRALKQEAESLLPQRLRQLADRHGFSYANTAVKRLSSRWGSCSQQKEITLNLFLMQLPWELIDYVLLHELVHTEHLDHSEKFWQRFESVMPGAKNFRKKLKAYKTVVTPYRA